LDNFMQFCEITVGTLLLNVVVMFQIVVKLGRALKDGEWRVKVFYLHVKEVDPLEFLVEAIIGSGMTVRQLKEQQIQRAFLNKLEKEIPIERIRIRKKSYRNPCRVYPDTLVFDKDVNVGYTTELFAEILEVDESVKGDDDRSVYVRCWNPSTYTLGDFNEVVLHKDHSNANLKKELEKISSIPADRIHIGKGRGVFPCMTSLLDMENEIDWNPMCLKLTEFPLTITDDGAVVYYKSCDEAVKLLTESEKIEIRKKEEKSSGSSVNHSTRPNYRKEKALKIYTNGVKR
jgi:ubiquitin carboxyl-terminal hydrolase 47